MDIGALKKLKIEIENLICEKNNYLETFDIGDDMFDAEKCRVDYEIDKLYVLIIAIDDIITMYSGEEVE